MTALPLARLVFLAPVFLAAVLAQTSAPAPTTPPAGRGPQAPAVVSPEIAADRHVTFRIRAANAKAVTVSGQFQKGAAPLTRDDAGLWSLTVGPVAPGVYEYSFSIDGVAMIDPANRDIKPMRAPRTSIFEVPGSPPLLTDFQDVPHGKVSLHWYASKSLGRRRPLQVYTPAGYDSSGTTRYPTLYLQHGNGDNEATWVTHGKAHWILDNLIAQKKAKPMIVVMLDGHAALPGTAAAGGAGGVAALERDLIEDAMPFVVANYRTREDAASRALAGLSMGGTQALQIGLKHTDTFAWVGCMSSSGGDARPLIADGAALNRRLKLLWVACGQDDTRVGAVKDLDAALTAASVKHEFLLTAGDHSWPVWRVHLAELAPKLF